MGKINCIIKKIDEDTYKLNSKEYNFQDLPEYAQTFIRAVEKSETNSEKQGILLKPNSLENHVEKEDKIKPKIHKGPIEVVDWTKEKRKYTEAK
ncbi:hypothetical protein GF374_01150 [Candidatus Woesearchaeota archaeon]|nr:hypothetical protein [Candidatus Woesearchaeota archaeon]